MIYPGWVGRKHARFTFRRVGNRSGVSIAIAGRASSGGAAAIESEDWGVMEQAFRIEEQVERGVPVVAVIGEIDVATAPQLRECLHRVIAEGRATVVLDLLGVTFLDSTALGVLVGALKRCRELGGELHIVVTDARIKKIFEITGLNKVFPIVDALAEVGAQ
jgi:anti-sigma B factor antagonist